MLPDVDQRAGGFHAVLALDTYDYAFFPTRGYKVDAEYFDAQNVNNQTGKFGKAQGNLGLAWTLGDVILVGKAERGASTSGVLPTSSSSSRG